MEKSDRVGAFNEWMRRFTEDPTGFDREFEMVGRFLQERSAGREPTYGETADAYLSRLVAERATPAVAGV